MKSLLMILLYLGLQMHLATPWAHAIDEAANEALIDKVILTLGYESTFQHLESLPEIRSRVAKTIDHWMASFQKNGRPIICRRPGLYELFRQFGDLAGPPVDEICPVMRFIVTEGPLLEIRFSEVREISYAVAGRGDELESRFGHTMIKIRTCPQDNESCSQSKGEPDELAYSDYIAGFAAQTLGSFNPIGGLTGQFPTQLTFSYAETVINKYVQEDFRNIFFSPLKLNRDQLRLFIYLLEERFWFYDQKYNFITDNCSSEVLKLLKIVLPPHLMSKLSNITIDSPMGIASILYDVRLANQNKTVDLKVEMPAVDEYLRDISGQAISLTAYTKTPAKTRRLWYIEKWNSIDENDKFQRIKLTNEWLILEEFVGRNLIFEIKKSLFQWISSDRVESSDDKTNRCHTELKQETKSLLNNKSIWTNRKSEGMFLPSVDQIVSEAERKKTFTKIAQLAERALKCGKNVPEIRQLENELKDVKINLKFTQNPT